MANISSIRVNVQTRSISGGGTDGDVYLGFAGREFYLDTSADDFEAGSTRSYVLGQGSNVLHGSSNDPRTPQLQDSQVDRFPVYLRFVPRGREDNWSLQRAVVTYNERLFPMWDSAEVVATNVGLWLGVHAGLVVHLPRHQDTPPVLT